MSKNTRLLNRLFFCGILGLFIFAILSGSVRLDPLDSQADKWQTLAGEWRSPGQAERFLRKILDKSATTAISVAVVQGPNVVFQRFMGIVDKKSNKPVDEQTVFRTASLSKPVFAYLVMKLVDEGAIDVDRPLYRYLERPLYEYPDYADLKDDERYQLLTVRLLLSHQSGFPNWRIMNRDRRLDFKFMPGKMFKYSGEGYKLLQFVLEEISGKDFNRLAREKVFLPLGMTNTSFLWEKRFDSNIAVNLRTGLRRLIERTRTIPNAAASLLTNTSDYAKFLLAVMNGKGLKPETHKMMLKPQVDITSQSLHAPQGTDPKIHETMHLGWSMGWGRFRCSEGDAIFHVGFEEGCDNYAVVFLDRSIGIVLQSVITKLEGIAPAVANELIGDIYSPFSWLMY
ncbi:MAG: serine hydrolase domain-containing protein [Candidatus Aminicenantes bacterium]|jgi:CubicO group peptidase (beta-lactamase class C family)